MKCKNFYYQKCRGFLLACYFLFLVGVTLVSSRELFARTSFDFKTGDDIQILSDKAYRRTSKSEYNAVGNVVIVHGTEMLYGEKASLKYGLGTLNVEGNVRYVGEGITFYGTSLFYNFKKNNLKVKDARIIADNFVVWGEVISRPKKGFVNATNAEYSTCRDCPESWSIFGKSIKITLGQYIRIKEAYIKVNGVTVLYVPYIILPIKKKRESGLLFPSFSFPSGEGVYYRQPWFWNISQSMDMTFTPSFFGLRGNGTEVQLRKVFGHRNWLEFDTILIRDQIFNENRSANGSEEIENRAFYEWEHHFSLGENLNHHLHYTNGTDLDLLKDFDFFTEKKTFSPEWGGATFLEFRNSFFESSIEGHFYRNQLMNSPFEFDEEFIQILPQLNFSTIPINLWNISSSLFKNMNIGFEADLKVFKQNHFKETNNIRNARRLNSSPYIDMTFFRKGPFDFTSKIIWDRQDYVFPYEKEEQTFSKDGFVFESSMSFELEKIFGLAYEEKLPLNQLDVEKYRNFRKKSERKKAQRKKELSDKNAGGLIGEFPSSDNYYKSQDISIKKDSYKHSQMFIFNHYYLTDQNYKGSQKFLNQISSSEGAFDHVDFLKTKKYLNTQLSPSTSLPKENTLEVQWNHSVIRKSVKDYQPFRDGRSLRDNFNFREVAYLNISQGIDFTVTDERLLNRLTRLYVNGGTTFEETGTTLSFSEYYFFSESFKGHKFNLDVGQRVLSGNVSFGWEQNTVNGLEPVRNLKASFSLSPVDVWNFSGEFKWNLQEKVNELSLYQVTYKPHNNCWRLIWGYKDDQSSKKFLFNFLVNFNDNSFTSLSDL